MKEVLEPKRHYLFAMGLPRVKQMPKSKGNKRGLGWSHATTCSPFLAYLKLMDVPPVSQNVHDAANDGCEELVAVTVMGVMPGAVAGAV